MIIPVILSGGSGTRLWPLSRKNYPKQYLDLTGGKTMLQETIIRLDGIEDISNPIIVCNTEHRFIVAEQCKEINITNPTILLEPIGRNTAPAIASATIQSIQQSNDAVLLVLSADHHISNLKAFQSAIHTAYNQAQKDKLIIFGIIPDEANTGYGYIKSSKKICNNVFEVDKFVEKPDLLTASSYLEEGDYLWNSGMFMFKANTLINELSIHAPDILSSAKQAVNFSTSDLDFIRLDKKSFEGSPSDSIDYALIEKSNNLALVPLDADWNDVGSWSSLYDISLKDKDGNVINGDVITQDTFNTYIHANHHIVATIGVENLIIIDTPDATFVASRDKAQEVKNIVDFLSKNDRYESSSHRQVYRPWGWFDSIESGENFQVKRLHVNAKAKLSLQMHYKRAEHWVVISGVATVTNGDKIFNLEKGESTYIPYATKHSLENKTSKPLEIIEVQSGSYLGEDDIIRFEDIYGR